MENTQINTESNVPSNLIALAIEKGVDVEKLEKLLALQERWEAKEATKFFFDALAKFQAEVKEIKKSKEVNFGAGKAKYKYAQLADIDEAIKEPLAKNGLSKTFQITEDGGKIYVTCKITHMAGHSEATTMSGSADNTGSKNAIQASGSTITYLQRYTLIGALGLTTADEDNDANTNRKKTEEPIVEAEISRSNMDDAIISKRKEFFALLKEARVDPEAGKDHAKNVYKVESFLDITLKDLTTYVANMREKLHEKKIENSLPEAKIADSPLFKAFLKDLSGIITTNMLESLRIQPKYRALHNEEIFKTEIERKRSELKKGAEK